MKIDLTGKIALVTGSAGQLGRVMALTLAECGADIALHYHNSDEQALITQKKIEKLGRRATTIQADVGDEPSVLAMRDHVVRKLGSPDIIVNNAIGLAPWHPVLEQSVASYENQFRTTVLQNVLMAQAFAPAMIRKKWGRVIAISTECAMQNFPSQSAYVAGKRGQDGVLRVLAREVGEHGITVNQVAPGWTISDNDRKNHTEVQADYQKGVPLKRRGEDREIAYAVAFLASDYAAFITGVYLPVTGGNVMPAI